MTIDEAVQLLSEGGLDAPAGKQTFRDIAAFGDQSTSGGITVVGWVCWINQQDSGWRVCPPPHPAPGPGPEFIVPTLEDAVSLTVFAFARRLPYDSEMRQEFEHAQCTYEEWLREHNE